MGTKNIFPSRNTNDIRQKLHFCRLFKQRISYSALLIRKWLSHGLLKLNNIILAQCPEQFPHVIDEGKACCKTAMSYLNPASDCSAGSVPCPFYPCRTRPGRSRTAEIRFSCGDEFKIKSLLESESKICHYAFSAEMECKNFDCWLNWITREK